MIPAPHRPKTPDWNKRRPASYLPPNSAEFVALCIAPELPYLQPDEDFCLWYDEFQPIAPERAAYFIECWAEAQIDPQVNLTIEHNTENRFLRVRRAATDDATPKGYGAAARPLHKARPRSNGKPKPKPALKAIELPITEPAPQEDLDKLQSQAAKTALELIPTLPKLEKNYFTILVDYPPDVGNLLAIRDAIVAWIDETQPPVAQPPNIEELFDAVNSDFHSTKHMPKGISFAVEPCCRDEGVQGIRVTRYT